MSTNRRLAPKPKQRSSLDPSMVKALAHPLRQDILAALNEGVSSPREISEKLGEPLGNVSYHVRTLLERNLIELVRTEPRRGAVEHFYRALQRPFFSDTDWESIPVTTRRAMFDRVIRRSLKDISRAGEAGGFDHVETHVSRTTLALDEQGWSDVTELLAETIEGALRIQAESAARMVELDAEERQPVSSQLIAMHFRNPGPKSKRGAG
jgi:DNA-binding transcriptional ArsR family regulator